MRVLIVTPWFPNRPGDQFGEFIYASALALRRSGVEVRVLVTRPWTSRFVPIPVTSNAGGRLHVEEFAPDLPVSTVRYPSIPRNWLRPVSNRLYASCVARRIVRMHKEWRFDLIHSHTEMGGFAALASGLPVPVVTTIHGINTDPRLDTPAQRGLVGRTLRACARVLLVGEPLREYFGGVAGVTGNFRVVHNGFTWPSDMSRDRDIAFQRPLRLVSASLLQEGKGVDLTLRALALLNVEGLRDWRYVVVGGGTMMTELRALAAQLGLNAQVSFTGAVAHRDIYAHLTQADVFVLPSYREAFGIAYLEAMAAGLYAIGVEGQGPSAYIRSGENGLLVPPSNVRAIADGLREILRDPARAERAARRGRADVFAGFTWELHARRLIEEYRAVLS